ncbi:Os06g0304300 [Oryza sativa Japonica Group]|uniref:Os06g0304300 protein n=1 Tax=Oryza sativa subsp. japonica TaxID=39947 RepID=Q5Z4E7_ORYSJ|nr:unknown protein [Oryza sativa Japonica Group]BAH93468.1 Os06g0304300 [Oryza sativa Japonica Group]|eukprot:NP_001174740.1 Os06g0304300 [Oryza sativa Japonica Group]
MFLLHQVMTPFRFFFQDKASLTLFLLEEDPLLLMVAGHVPAQRLVCGELLIAMLAHVGVTLLLLLHLPLFLSRLLQLPLPLLPPPCFMFVADNGAGAPLGSFHHVCGQLVSCSSSFELRWSLQLPLIPVVPTPKCEHHTGSQFLVSG